jgi:hypothetical protein
MTKAEERQAIIEAMKNSNVTVKHVSKADEIKAAEERKEQKYWDQYTDHSMRKNESGIYH